MTTFKHKLTLNKNQHKNWTRKKRERRKNDDKISNQKNKINGNCKR